MRDGPLSPLNTFNEDQERTETFSEPMTILDEWTREEELTEVLRSISLDIQSEGPISAPEEDCRNEEPNPSTTPDSNIGTQASPHLGSFVQEDTTLGGTSIPSTSGIGSSRPPFSFEFLGARLLGEPLEALASVLSDGLFEDIGRTTPFKLAQDIVESQIAVHLSFPFFL